MGQNPSANATCGGSCPVENVSWSEAQEFIRRLNERGAAKYRLPTEAEWEYAARGGDRPRPWAGTSDPAQLGTYAWYIENAFFQSHPVGEKKPNEFGLYDMSGNVWQWTSSPAGDGKHEVRGGSWDNPAKALQTSKRLAWADRPDAGMGFRCVKD